MGNLNRIMLLCIVPASILKGTAAALINVPRNEVVFLNASIELQCSTNSVEPINWSFIPADGHIVTDWLLIHGNFTAYSVGKYKIDRSIRGQYNLVIDSVDFSYAGRYRCTEGSFGTESEAELVVIDTMNSLTPPDSYAVISRPTLAVTMMLYMAVLIGVSVYFRANVKAWAIQHCALITHREPDFVRMGQENRYYASITHQGSNRNDLLSSTLTANQTNVIGTGTDGTDGTDGTEYVEMSGVKPPDRIQEEHAPRTSAFNKLVIYASIDHSGTVPAPPLPPKSSIA